MIASAETDWPTLLAAVLSRYDNTLLEAVASAVVRPRGAISAGDRAERIIGALDNPVIVDRRLGEISDVSLPSRHLLAVMAHFHSVRVQLSDVVSLTATLGHSDPLVAVRCALEAGLVFPDLRPPGSMEVGQGILHSFEAWLAGTPVAHLALLIPPVVMNRALPCPLGLPDIRKGEQVRPIAAQAAFVAEQQRRTDAGLPLLDDEPATPVDPVLPLGGAIEGDGFDIPCRLAVLWQLAGEAPVRLTQAGEFYRRDSDRLRQLPALSIDDDPTAAALPDYPGFLVDLARAMGILACQDTDLVPGTFPGEWKSGTYAMLESCYRSLFEVRAWTPRDGWKPDPEKANPFPSAELLALLLLAELPASAWVRSIDIENWIHRHHPYWKGAQRPARAAPWLEAWLAGVAQPLRLVEMARLGLSESDGRAVRLTSIGRWLTRQGPQPGEPPNYPQAMVVQPNLEILVYRQALTPVLLCRLTQIGAWKSVGNACVLQLDKDTVYRGLESGESLEDIKTLLENHSGRQLPGSVMDQLKTWAGRRERLTVFPAATLLEFASDTDLDDALARGMPILRVGARFAVLLDETLGYKHVRIAGNRDYGLPPEPCLVVGDDGVTLTVDVGRSDLLLEIELPMLTDPVAPGERGIVRLTPASLQRATDAGWTNDDIARWFLRRAGHGLTAAGRALLTAHTATGTLEKRLVLSLSSSDVLDGLMQWPPTAACLGERLGPCTVVVPSDKVGGLATGLKQLGLEIPTNL